MTRSGRSLFIILVITPDIRYILKNLICCYLLTLISQRKEHPTIERSMQHLLFVRPSIIPIMLTLSRLN